MNLTMSTVNERNNIEKNVVKPALPDIVSLLIRVSTQGDLSPCD